MRDRVVQTAFVARVGTDLRRHVLEHSYGFRHGRGCHHALRWVEELLEQAYVYVVDADLKSYFDTIPKRTSYDAASREGVGQAGAAAD